MLTVKASEKSEFLKKGELLRRIDRKHIMPNKLAAVYEVSSFDTPIGFMAIIGHQGVLHRLLFGFTKQNDLNHALKALGFLTTEADWNPMLRELLHRYAEGEEVSFAAVDVALEDRGNFRHRVLQECRKIPFGTTMTYSQLAEAAGSPRAARAVGNAMANNKVPLVIPCHRVVGTHGRLCGFSAPRGVALKQQLLQMEANTLCTHS